MGGYLCYGVTLLPENLTKEILEYALDEEGLGLRLSNMGTLITEQGGNCEGGGVYQCRL